MGDFSVQEFNAEDFQFEHEDRLNERNGQWLDENMNTSLWLSQGCYVSGKCIVEGEYLMSHDSINETRLAVDRVKPRTLKDLTLSLNS